jgi:hypothetical protein
MLKMGKWARNIRVKIISFGAINSLLNKTYFYYKYKKTVLSNIIPKLDSIGLTNPNLDTDQNVTILVPYIETSFKKIFILILILKALQLRGAKILFLICNEALPICERYSSRSRSGACKYCKFINSSILPRFGFDLIEIKNYLSESDKLEIDVLATSLIDNQSSEYFYHGVDIIPIVNDSLSRYYYGATPINSDKKHSYYVTALMSTKVAHNIHLIEKPDIMVSHMYAYSEFQPYNIYYENQPDIPVFCLKGSPWKTDSININSMDVYRNEIRYNTYLASRKTETLNSQELNELKHFIDDRFKGINDEFALHSYYDNKADTPQINALNIDKNLKNVFLFSNVEWDVGLVDCHAVFKDVMDWVYYTIEAMKGNDEVHLYIKTHPNEVFGVKSALTVAQKILVRYPKLPENVTLITPDMKIKPYSLFPHIDVGVVLSGTLGLEMALKNVPVIITGLAPYARKGFVQEPKDKIEYHTMLHASTNKISFDYEKLLLFAHFYFIKMLIPLNLVDKYYGVDFQDIKYLVSSVKDLEVGKDYHLDHICDCILQNKCIEAW